MKTGMLGPHEGIELELMLAGRKNVALFEAVPDQFDYYLKRGYFLLKIVDFIDFNRQGFIIYQKEHEQAAERLAEILLNSVGCGFQPETEREIGRILGYSERDIAYYIRHIR